MSQWCICGRRGTNFVMDGTEWQKWTRDIVNCFVDWMMKTAMFNLVNNMYVTIRWTEELMFWFRDYGAFCLSLNFVFFNSLWLIYEIRTVTVNRVSVIGCWMSERRGIMKRFGFIFEKIRRSPVSCFSICTALLDTWYNLRSYYFFYHDWKMLR